MNAALAPRPQRLRTPLGFAVAATLFFIIDGAVVHSEIFARRPDLLSAAASFDVTIGVTLVYWLLVVRPGRAALRTILPEATPRRRRRTGPSRAHPRRTRAIGDAHANCRNHRD